MASPDYTPAQALKLIMTKLEERDGDLANNVRAAIDAGKDIDEEQISGSNRKTRQYRKSVPFTEMEALRILATVLKAHFIEQPLFLDSLIQDFEPVVIEEGNLEERQLLNARRDMTEDAGGKKDIAKNIKFESQTETQISESNEPVFDVKPISGREIDEQRSNLAEMEKLLDFKEE